MHSNKKSPRITLQDIITYIRLADEIIAGIKFETFVDIKEKVLAVTRCLEIISEASRRLPKDIHTRNPHIHWQQIASAGNFYRHEYEIVEEQEIWDTVKRDLPPLLVVAEAELSQLPQ